MKNSGENKGKNRQMTNYVATFVLKPTLDLKNIYYYLKTVSKGKFLLGFTYLHIDFTLNKASIRVFPIKTEYVTDAPLMKLMMRYTSYSHAHHPKMTVII